MLVYLSLLSQMRTVSSIDVCLISHFDIVQLKFLGKLVPSVDLRKNGKVNEI